MQRIQVVDSHTGGEPTRIIVAGGPDLGDGMLADRRSIFAEDFDHIRRAVVTEPRGSDILIGGLLCDSSQADCVAGVIFFESTGFLGMCGHGMMGFVVTLKHLGRIGPGKFEIETPVGIVDVELSHDNQVTIQNVPSYRVQKDVPVAVPDYGEVVGDIAWGGNWYFLVKNSQERLARDATDHLLTVTKRIRNALQSSGITGPGGETINQVNLYGPPHDLTNHSRNFVLCPSGQYDRSPCGTGTSAKLACLAADGALGEGDSWREESIIGSVFECSYQHAGDGKIVPTIRGTAHISGESTLILDPTDPYCMGIDPAR